jgi:hypothetical protein
MLRLVEFEAEWGQALPAVGQISRNEWVRVSLKITVGLQKPNLALTTN